MQNATSPKPKKQANKTCQRGGKKVTYLKSKTTHLCKITATQILELKLLVKNMVSLHKEAAV